jgi:DNA-binding MarR family transcriptional regulator
MNKGIVELIFELKLTCMSKEESIRKDLKLSPAEYKGLLALEPGRVFSCMQLSDEMGLSKSRGSRVIDKLIDNGYVKEAIHSDDKRVFNVTLSQKGLNAIKKINSVMNECELAILKNIPESELKAFTQTLHKITEIVKPG